VGGAARGMGVVWALAIHTPEYGMVPGTAPDTTGSSGAGMAPSRVWGSTPPARSRVGAFVVMVSIAVAVGTLGVGIETQPAFSPISC